MFAGKKIACVIPARLSSTRFFAKVLTSIAGKPLLQWVWQAATSTPYFDSVIFAIDAQETATLIESFGGAYHMTSIACTSGTERIIELFEQKVLDADVIVNWQGDEPFVTATMIAELLQSIHLSDEHIWTLKKRITKQTDIQNPHIAKVVCDYRGRALYFSRYPIPFYRDKTPEEAKIYFKHVGLYAFTPTALHQIAATPPFYAENAEQLEQLRWLAAGIPLRVHETTFEVMGIDLPEHVAMAEAFMRNQSNAQSTHQESII